MNKKSEKKQKILLIVCGSGIVLVILLCTFISAARRAEDSTGVNAENVIINMEAETSFNAFSTQEPPQVIFPDVNTSSLTDDPEESDIFLYSFTNTAGQTDNSTVVNAENDTSNMEADTFSTQDILAEDVFIPELIIPGSITQELVTQEPPRVTFSGINTIYLTDDLEESDIFTIEADDSFTYVVEPAIDELEEGTQTITITYSDALSRLYQIEQTYEVANVPIAIDYDFEGMTAEDVLFEYIQDNKLTEDNFAFFYYNTNTGEEYVYNEQTTFTAASTIKLPLNLLYYDMIAAEEISEDSTLVYYSGCTASGAGSTASRYSPGNSVPLSYLLEQSILYSDNTAANILIAGLGYSEYRNRITRYSDEEFVDEFYTSNLTTSAFAYDVMRYLYENSDCYPTLLEDMTLACEGHYLKKNFDYYTVAHKYGSYNGYVHDYGIIYTPSPYLIGVFTKNVYNAETIISELNILYLQYTLSTY